MSRRINGLMMGIEFPENPKHQLEGCRHEVMVRPVSVLEGFPPEIVNRPLQLQTWQRAIRFGYFAR